jgi:hypothetical protein
VCALRRPLNLYLKNARVTQSPILPSCEIRKPGINFLVQASLGHQVSFDEHHLTMKTDLSAHITKDNSMKEEDWALIRAATLHGQVSRSSIAQAAQFSKPNGFKNFQLAPTISNIDRSVTCQGSLQEVDVDYGVKQSDQTSCEEDRECCRV